MMLWVPKWSLTPFPTVPRNDGRFLSSLLKIYMKILVPFISKEVHTVKIVTIVMFLKCNSFIYYSSKINCSRSLFHHSAWGTKAGRPFMWRTALGNEILYVLIYSDSYMLNVKLQKQANCGELCPHFIRLMWSIDLRQMTEWDWLFLFF